MKRVGLHLTGWLFVLAITACIQLCSLKVCILYAVNTDTLYPCISFLQVVASSAHVKMYKATKYILSSSNLSYKQRLTTLQMLPLMYWLELQDIIFFVKSIKEPPDNFSMNEFVTFASGKTRSASFGKLIHNLSSYSTTRHFYFNRIARL